MNDSSNTTEVIGDYKRTLMKKVAFFTPGFLSEDSTQGGIGNYIYKISSALKSQDHQPEIFVKSIINDEEVMYNGIKVYRVFVNYFILRAFRKVARILHVHKYYKILEDIINSFLFYRKFKAVHKEVGYDIVQTPNYRFPGFFIPRNPDFCHLHRISSNRILFDLAEHGEVNFRQKIINRIEVYCAKRANIIYAPSQYIADYLREEFDLDVKIVRPPSYLGDIKFCEYPHKIPQKYFLHYGSMGRRKGTDLIPKALKMAWEEQPDIKVVFMGDLNSSSKDIKEDDYWGNFSENVFFLGQTEKKYVYNIVKNSVATVLPSRSDNLPNTVIESLYLGTPVIGTYNSSIDEIVEDGKNGLLVSKENTKGLSNSMIKLWTEEVIFNRSEVPLHNLLEPFKAKNAISNFFDLCK